MKKLVPILLLITNFLHASYNPNMATSDDKLASTNYIYKASGNRLVKSLIIDTGNIGIGSTSPEEKLTVTGYIRASSGYKIGANDINTAGTLSNVAYRNQDNTFSTSQTLTGNLSIKSGSNGQEMFLFTEAGSASNAALYMKYNGNTTINLNAMSSANSYFNAGNVGIGTITPGSKLEIIDSITTQAYTPMLNVFNPNVPNGSQAGLIAFGHSFLTAEMGHMSFVGSATAGSERISFGIHSKNDLFNILGTGNVGIGTTAPTYKLEVEGTMKIKSHTSDFIVFVNEDVGGILPVIRTNASFVGSLGTPSYLWKRAYVHDLFRNYEYSASDIRLKENIIPITNPLNNLLKLQAYKYDFKLQYRPDDNKRKNNFGLIAQEVQQIYPDLVKENEEGFLYINYEGMIPLLLEAIKEQQTQIEELKNLIQS